MSPNIEESVQSPVDDDKPVLEILYQDEYFVAVHKPAGLFVHRSFMGREEKYFALQLVRDQVGQYVYPLHRLDKPTAGVLLFGLSKEIAQQMGQAFSEHKVEKTYYALTRGFLLEAGQEGEIDYPLKEKLDKIGDKFAQQDKPEQSAFTKFNTIKTAALAIPLGNYPTVRYSLVKLQPTTGRRHQLRRHLAHLRHPIIGDINYGDNKQNPFFAQHFGFKRLMLLAKSIRFIHPVTQNLVYIETGFDHQWQQVFQALNWQISN